jgi:hypothetical protein
VVITPEDDFRAFELKSLFGEIGASLDILVIRLQHSAESSPAIQKTVLSHCQLRNVQSGLFISGDLAGSESRRLLPRLTRFRVLSTGDVHQHICTGNLVTLLAQCPRLVELDLSGAPIDIGTFMTAVEFLNKNGKDLEVLKLDLKLPWETDPTHHDTKDSRLIDTALAWLLGNCNELNSLRSLSIIRRGLGESADGPDWFRCVAE